MAVRTTESAVKGIIETQLLPIEISLTPFIETASHLVTRVCTSATYDATDLEIIERWLSAHMYAIRDPRYLQETAGPVRAEYRSKVDLGFDVTHYGQQAMRLAYMGELGALNDKIKKGKGGTIGVGWVGTEALDKEDKVI